MLNAFWYVSQRNPGVVEGIYLHSKDVIETSIPTLKINILSKNKKSETFEADDIKLTFIQEMEE